MTDQEINNAIADIAVAAGLYTRDGEIYTLPLIHKGYVFKPNTETISQIPPKYASRRPSSARFDPVNDASIGLPIIEHFEITVGTETDNPTPDYQAFASHGVINIKGRSYLHAGCLAVIELNKLKGA